MAARAIARRKGNLPKGKMRRMRPKRARPNKGSTLALIVLALMVVTALPLCVVLCAGLAPTIAAGVADRNPKRYLLKTVGVLNLAGMVMPLGIFLQAGITANAAALVLFDPYKWLWMYGAAALGWLCYLAAPPLARSFMEARAARLDRELERRAEALVEEWGEEVTARGPEGGAAGPAA